MKNRLLLFTGTAILLGAVGGLYQMNVRQVSAQPATQQIQAQQNCDPAYPTVCIAPPPPDLDCIDIPYKSFPVRRRSDPSQPDPHRFDGDNDGIGCEPPP